MQCESAQCTQQAVVRFIEVRERAIKREHRHCERHASLVWDACLSENRNAVGQGSTVPGFVAFELELLVDDRANDRNEIEKMLLREVAGKRVLVLPIGYLELCLLYYCVDDSRFKWMSPHGTMARMIKLLGAKLLTVMISSVSPEGYYEGKATFAHDQGILEMPIRPSDGLCLALLSGVTYLVAEDVLGNKK